MLGELQTVRYTVGLKQSMKKIRGGEAKKAFVAENASPRLTDEVAAACEAAGVPVEWVPDMFELGRACNIDVGAAVAVVY